LSRADFGDVVNPHWKRCSRCELFLPFGSFNVNKLKPGGLRYECRECYRAWRLANIDSVRASVNRSNEKWKSKHPGRAAESYRKWRALNTETARARTRTWYKANPDKTYKNAARRRALERAAFVEDVVPSVVFARDGGICGLCMKKVLRADMSMDHIVPLARGGLHCYANIQLAHLRCNISKGARTQQPRPEAAGV
jgi:5-methylcytosine-specific restriction endonuclease McrA